MVILSLKINLHKIIIRLFIYFITPLALLFFIYLLFPFRPVDIGPEEFSGDLYEKDFYDEGFSFSYSEEGWGYYDYYKDTTFIVNNKKTFLRIYAHFKGVGPFSQMSLDYFTLDFKDVGSKRMYADFLKDLSKPFYNNNLYKTDVLIKIVRQDSFLRIPKDSLDNIKFNRNIDLIIGNVFNISGKDSLFVGVNPFYDIYSDIFYRRFAHKEKEFYSNYIPKKYWPPWYKYFK